MSIFQLFFAASTGLYPASSDALQQSHSHNKSATSAYNGPTLESTWSYTAVSEAEGTAPHL